MSSDAMSCAEAEPLLPLVADGAVTPDSDAQLFAHLASCADCQRAVASHDLIALAIAQAPRIAQPRPYARILRWWPYAAAASLTVAVGGMWLAERRPAVAPTSVIAATPAAPSAAPPVEAVAAAREVIAMPRSDGSTVYLVRQGDAWIAVDPANPDGPAQPAHHDAADVPVRY